MFQAKEGVLDRIEQSFGVFKKGFVPIFLPFFLFQIVSLGIIPQLLKFLSLGFIQSVFENFQASTHSIPSVQISILVVGIIIYIIIYLLLLIPIVYATFLTITQVIREQAPTPLENTKKGFLNIGNLFRIYWYIFMYVYMIPALCFIIGGVMLVVGTILGANVFIESGRENAGIYLLMSAGGIAMTLSVLYGVVQAIYRGTKTSFSIPSAVFENDFSKTNFDHSVNITHKKWWRIIGNFLLVGIIGGLIIGLISGLLTSLGLFHAVSSNDITELLIGSIQNRDVGELNDYLDGNMSFSIIGIILGLIEQCFDIVLSVFVFVFTMVFYLRLKDEYNGTQNPNDALEALPLVEEL